MLRRPNRLQTCLTRRLSALKVDREERPDIDAAYMAVCQAMGRNCGWPLNVILTPNLNPFFVQATSPKPADTAQSVCWTLFHKLCRFGKPSVPTWNWSAKTLSAAYKAMENRPQRRQLNEQCLPRVMSIWRLDFDEENGGFGVAPKFPTPHRLLFLMRY